MKMELRTNQTTLESNGDLVVRGYVNKPGALSQVLGSVKKFREKIAPGAFTKAIENRNREIDFLAEHDKDKMLASTRNGSLTLREDNEGLYMEARITPTTYGKDYYTLIADGLVGAMSFGFRALKDSWDFVEGMAIRTVHELELFEVSAVKDPAYTQSVISARGIDLIEDVEVPDKISGYSENKIDERGNNNMEILETRTNEFEAMLKGETRALQTTAEGAALIPENVQKEIILKVEEISPVFAKARKFPSKSGKLRVARETDTLTAEFVPEGESLSEAEVNFTYVALENKRVGKSIKLSKQFIHEAVENGYIEAYVKNMLARSIAKKVEQVIFTGDGVVEFKGILNEEEVKAIELEAANKMNSLKDMLLSVHPEFLEGAGYIMNRSFFNEVAKLEDKNGHTYIQNGVVNGKLTYTLFGMPVDITEALPAETPAVFGNINDAYGIVVKEEQTLVVVDNDSTNAKAGTKLYVYDAYMDGATVNPQAIVKLTVTSA